VVGEQRRICWMKEEGLHHHKKKNSIKNKKRKEEGSVKVDGSGGLDDRHPFSRAETL